MTGVQTCALPILVEVYAEDNEDNVEDVTSDPAKTEVTEEVRAEMAEDINQILTDPDTLSKILGHSSVEVTEQAYLDLTDDDISKQYHRASPMGNF